MLKTKQSKIDSRIERDLKELHKEKSYTNGYSMSSYICNLVKSDIMR